MHVSLELAAGVVATGRAEAKRNGAVVLKTILNDVAIVGGIERGEEDQLLAATAAAVVVAHQAAVADLLYDGRWIAEHLAERTGLVLADIAEIEIVRHIPEARTAAVIGHEDLRDAGVAEYLDPALVWSLLNQAS